MRGRSIRTTVRLFFPRPSSRRPLHVRAPLTVCVSGSARDPARHRRVHYETCGRPADLQFRPSRRLPAFDAGAVCSAPVPADRVRILQGWPPGACTVEHRAGIAFRRGTEPGAAGSLPRVAGSDQVNRPCHAACVSGAFRDCRSPPLQRMSLPTLHGESDPRRSDAVFASSSVCQRMRLSTRKSC